MNEGAVLPCVSATADQDAVVCTTCVVLLWGCGCSVCAGVVCCVSSWSLCWEVATLLLLMKDGLSNTWCRKPMVQVATATAVNIGIFEITGSNSSCSSLEVSC